jgi:hypothetical protein
MLYISMVSDFIIVSLGGISFQPVYKYYLKEDEKLFFVK